MNVQSSVSRLSLVALAMQGVFAAMAAMPARADDAEAAALKMPTNVMEMGLSVQNRDSAKFGEYTGLNKSGAYVNGGFNVRGGDAYGDANGTMRWSLTGTDVGLTSRNLGAAISDQGRWDFRISFDELRHNTSDSYQTPYVEGNGSSRFTLPAGFGLVANTRTMTAAQLAQFHNLDISNTRENINLGGGFVLGKEWNIKVDFNHLDQSGAKLMGFGSSAVGGATGERVSILPMPTNTKTDQVNVALNWSGEKGHATGAYYGSFFHNNVNGVAFQTWQTASVMQTMGTAPNNDFHQLNLTGGYTLAAKTKVAGGLSYGRNTQNAPYAYDSALAGGMVNPSPTSSLNGVVVTKHADVKLTNQDVKDLTLSAGYKYDLRNNRTSSYIYDFFAIDGSVGNQGHYPNTPLSNRKSQLELAGDYRLTKAQQVRLAFTRENIQRWCDQYAVSANYPAGTNCVVGTGSNEDKLAATYRIKATEDVRLSAGYTFSNRKSNFDEAARAAMNGFNGNAIVAGATIRGINGGDFLGFHPWFEGSRRQHLLKAGVNWQATEALTVDFTGRYAHDVYNTIFGMKNGTAASINFDTTYAMSDDTSVSAYFTRQNWAREMTDLLRSPTAAGTAATATAVAVPPGATWKNTLKDFDTVLGLGFKRTGLMAGKLELSGDLTYSIGKSVYATGLEYFTTTTGGLTCATATIMSCGALPDVNSIITTLKLVGTYKIDKNASVVGGLLWRQMKADDYFYNGLQYSYTPTGVLPTNQQAGNYSVSVVSVAYSYKFQ